MKESLLKYIPDSSLKAIPLAGNESKIDWEEEGKEFSFNGEMYDVVRTGTLNGQTVFYCCNDEKEDLLLQQMNDITKSNTQNTGKNNKLPEIKLVYDFVVINRIDFFVPYFHNADEFIHYDVALLQQTTPIIAPPPRA